MRLAHVPVALALLVACGPQPYCEPFPVSDDVTTYFASCGEPGWRAFCAGGFDPDRYGRPLHGSEYAYCNATGQLVCDSGASAYCDHDPWLDTTARYLECFDANGDGFVRDSETPVYDPGPPFVACIDEDRFDCVENLETLAPADAGLGCEWVEPLPPNTTITLFVSCAGPGATPRCAYSDGELVPLDQAAPHCIMPVPEAIAAMCSP